MSKSQEAIWAEDIMQEFRVKKANELILGPSLTIFAGRFVEILVQLVFFFYLFVIRKKYVFK